nr:hypothetical protein [uncultured Ruminococcus sp.]
MINRLKKFICICGVCVLSITTLSFATVANAEDYVDNSQEAVYTTAPAVVNTEPVYTQSQEPANNNVNAYTYAQDYTQAPVVDNNSNNSNDNVNTASYNFYDDDGEVSDNNSDTDTDTNADSNSDTDTGSENAETTTPTYKNVKEIDDTELKDSDWDKISKELSKNKSKGKSSSPFDYIKNSEKATGWDAFINNLNWASTLALVSFALALICIIIFVIFTIKKIRNKRKGLPNVKVKSNKSDVSGSHAIIEDDEEDNFDEISSDTNAEPEETQNISSHAKSAHGGAEDYGDDYDEEDFKDVHYVKPADKPKKKKLKQDTSEIIIPNKYKR